MLWAGWDLAVNMVSNVEIIINVIKYYKIILTHRGRFKLQSASQFTFLLLKSVTERDNKSFTCQKYTLTDVLFV